MPNKIVAAKTRWNPFYETAFESSLRLRGVDTIIVNGGSTEIGITATVYAAQSLDFDLEKPYRNLEAFASANSIEVVNTYPALKRRADAGAKLYLRSDPHFNALGHEVFAAEIFAYLKQPQ